MTVTETSEPEGGWEPWMDNPFMTDQAQGTVLQDTTLYQMQTRGEDGKWTDLLNPRADRDEVTRVQAFHLNKDKDDLNLRVLTTRVTWTVDEVPGYGDGQTPPEEIIARNEENKKQLAAEGEQPSTTE